MVYSGTLRRWPSFGKKRRAPSRPPYDALVKRLTDLATAEGALGEGRCVPGICASGRGGRSLSLSSELLKPGPLVINFYRGQWCPFCSAAVEAMSAATPTISGGGCDGDRRFSRARPSVVCREPRARPQFQECSTISITGSPCIADCCFV